jgi:MoaA/NifB/PqqE/SkfB family radical SAM enzyme
MIRSIINNEKMFTIKWRLTEWCNYRCSYCLRKFKGQDTKLDEIKILKIAPQVNRLIEEANTDVKLNLIGGEITFLDLKRIISLLKSNNLKKIHITTNFSNKLTWYIDFANYLLKRNIMLSMNVSYHNEYTNLDDFINKAIIFKRTALNLYSFKLEFVVAPENEKLLKEVKYKCKEAGLDYLIELDKSQSEEYFKKLNIQSSVSKPRWIINYIDGTNNKDITRSQLINQFEDKLCPSKYYYCTSGATYIYIREDKVAKNSTCIHGKQYTPIEKYHIDKNIYKCNNPVGKCSLCGDFSISLNKEELYDIFKK